MAREISIREEYLNHCDDATLQRALDALRQEFLLLELDGYCIEVAEQDHLAVRRALEAFRREHERNVSLNPGENT